MTRRGVLMMFIGPASNNAVVRAANEFMEAYKAWARTWNTKEPGTISIEEVKAWEKLPELWRRLEKVRRMWLEEG